MDASLADIAAAKAKMRARLRFRRDRYAASLSDVVLAVAFRSPPAPLRSLLTEARCVGGYAELAGEAPVNGLLAAAAASGVLTALPWFAARDDAMQFAVWNAGDALATGPWRVPQPESTDADIVPSLLLCPLLGFDRRGGRLGQGGGHYDRYLAVHGDILRVGIAWSVQEVDDVPCAPHDLMLDAVLTEQEWIMTGERL